MKPTEHSTKTSFAGTGVFALLRGLLRIQGTSTPQITKGIGVSIALVFAFALLAPGAASATFTRKFERQITSVAGPGGVAVNSENDLWVGNFTEDGLFEFSSAATGNTLLSPAPVFRTFSCVADPGSGAWEESACLTKTTKEKENGNVPPEKEPAGPFEREPSSRLGITPQSVAVESSTAGNGDVYVGGTLSGSAVEVFEPTGALVKKFGNFDEPHVAVDNNPESSWVDGEDPDACGNPTQLKPKECTVYVLSDSGNGDALEKFSSEGTPEPFECKSAACAPYITGNRITGVPSNPTGGFNFGGGSVATDAAGDIYVASTGKNSVYEFEPTGEYKHAFEGLSSPRGVAVDPVSGHLVVSTQGGIFEFNIETGQLVADITETSETGPFERPGSGQVAVDSLGDLYLAHFETVLNQGAAEQHMVDVWGPGVYDPTVTLGQANPRTGTTAELNGLVNPAQYGNTEQESTLKECYFQYVQEGVFKAATNEEEAFAHAEQRPCVEQSASEIKSEPEEEHPVRGKATGLTAGVTYYYRLVATAGSKLGGTEETAALAFTAPAKPQIVSTSAENLSSTFADLRAQIDPLGAATSYFFEYGPTTAYGHDAPILTEKAAEGESIGTGGPTGGAVESVLQHVGLLSPGTTYHFRVVAVNECEAVEHPGRECVSEGEDETFTTVPAAVSSERGYELVTPAEKEGGSDLFAEALTNSEYENTLNTGVPAESGDAFLLATKSPFGEFPAAGENRYVFRREPERGRWSYVSLSDPALGVQALGAGSIYPLPISTALFEPADLGRVAFGDVVGSTLSSKGAQNVDLVGAPGGPYTTLYKDPSFAHSEEVDHVLTVPVGASRDLSHVVLESNGNSACGSGEGAAKVSSGPVVCEWDGESETREDGEVVPKLTLVNLAPGSETEPVSKCGAVLGTGADPQDAVSADGSRVFFTAEACKGNSQQVYMRAGGETVEVSAPEAGVALPASEHYEAEYVGASEDGSRVYFVTASELTADDAGIHDPELYEYDTETGKLTRVSAGESDHEAAGVVTVYAVAAQGTAVYFTANGVLAANEGPDGSHASRGDCSVRTELSCNLYRYQPAISTTPAKISFVARVNENDVTHTGAGGALNPSGGDLRAESTPDGRYLLFDTREDLTGYSTAGCIADSEPCMELYRYDAQAAEEGRPAVVCVSCDQSGAPPVSNAFFERSNGGTGFEPVRAISNNGQYVFFDSADPLVPQASNGTLDVYQWHAGVLSLIGSGDSASPTYFLGYAPYEYTTSGGERRVVEGGNVFIGTHAQLTSQNTNGNGEIYDARICETESPCFGAPPGETLQCEGGSCQTPPSAPPDPVATLLATPGGGGPNSLAPATTKVTKKTATTCKKGYVKKKVKKRERCVRKAKPKKAKKASNGKGRA